MRPTTLTLEVSGKDPDTIQTNLTAAVDTAITQAMAAGGHGILVTQHTYNDFTVTLHPDVPYGQTREERRLDKTPG
ncbi:hypothetical protein QFZ23_004329 [Arthrobacter globiformis]|uniref:hypothetical protein n=1 Tax=Arthrobacter globiformis TaxID=1665 RepID=UPI002788C44D|nr:hypothetical protein [Arthrobacter globiformis]MDQ1060428.1 hypothetical protein [Arthrobacter globiformis]